MGCVAVEREFARSHSMKTAFGPATVRNSVGGMAVAALCGLR